MCDTTATREAVSDRTPVARETRHIRQEANGRAAAARRLVRLLLFIGRSARSGAGFSMGHGMRRTLTALAAGMILAGLAPAWADQPAPPSDPAEFEIIAVKPRNPDAKPVISSIPLTARAQAVADDVGRTGRPDKPGG